MHIVIKIHEKDYQSILNGHIPFSVIDAIMNGKPLSKGHGRIIDESKIKTVFTQTEEVYSGTLKTERTYILYTDAPTIIEDERKGAES